MSQTTSTQTPAWLASIPRTPSRFSQMWQIPVFLLGCLTFLIVAFCSVVQTTCQEHEFTSIVAEVRQLITSNELDDERLMALAEQMLEASPQYPERAGETHFLYAWAVIRTIENEASQDTEEQWAIARGHLEQAEVLGVPNSDRPRMWYGLGLAHFHTGGDPKQVVAYLSRSLPEGADDPASGYGLLTDVNLKLPEPDVDAALEANDLQIKYSRDEKVLTPARLLRGELLLRRGQYSAALQVLDQISATASPESKYKAMYLKAVACEAQKLWNQAIPLWSALLQQPEDVPGGKRRILYMLGHCYLRANPAQPAEAIKVWQKALPEGGDEGQAAAIHLADVQLRMDSTAAPAALSVLEPALSKNLAPTDWSNPLISLDEVASTVEFGVQSALENEAFAEAKRFALLLPKVTDIKSAELGIAEVCTAWATHLETLLHSKHDGVDRPALHAQSLALWKETAIAYQKATQVHSGPDAQEWLWRGIEAYRRAAEPAAALQALQVYLQLSLPPEKTAQAWYMLALVQRDAGHAEHAREAFYKCLEFPNTPWAYRARYELALEQIALGHLEQAERILRDNLAVNDSYLDREAHEQTLYRLALLLYQRTQYSQAAIYMKEALRRYPDHAQSLMMRDVLGDCYRRLADEFTEKIRTRPDSVTPNALTYYRHSQQELLSQAAFTYQQLIEQLEDKRRSQTVHPPYEERLHRKALFVLADLQFDMNNFSDALHRYKELLYRYRGEAEELMACLRLWRCCSVLQDPVELRDAVQTVAEGLRSAQANLPRIPDAQFEGSWPRQRWQEWLQEALTQLPHLQQQVQK